MGSPFCDKPLYNCRVKVKKGGDAVELFFAKPTVFFQQKVPCNGRDSMQVELNRFGLSVGPELVRISRDQTHVYQREVSQPKQIA